MKIIYYENEFETYKMIPIQVLVTKHAWCKD